MKYLGLPPLGDFPTLYNQWGITSSMQLGPPPRCITMRYMISDVSTPIQSSWSPLRASIAIRSRLSCSCLVNSAVRRHGDHLTGDARPHLLGKGSATCAGALVGAPHMHMLGEVIDV
eukprot:jgi/Botrbrau1/21663/Bobra.43_1s0062.1